MNFSKKQPLISGATAWALSARMRFGVLFHRLVTTDIFFCRAFLWFLLSVIGRVEPASFKDDPAARTDQPIKLILPAPRAGLEPIFLDGL
jgi:hypothetical protein